LILTSETYQRTSAFPKRASKLDPDNKLLWRFTPRRLEAEAIRDSILAVSGQLNRTMFGSGTLDPGQKRRSIYFTVKRSLLNPMLTLYDAPETLTSAGRRNSTTTAPQALLLINSPYIRELAQAFAARVSPLYHEPTDAISELLAASIHGSPDVDIAVPNGRYTLQLLLYEGWHSRSADIVIEGKTVRNSYNMFKEQGSTFEHGSVLRHTFTLTDGNIDIAIKGPLHLGGLILSGGNSISSDPVAIVKSRAALKLTDVIKAINFGDTKRLTIGDVTFSAASVNTTVDGVSNKATGDVYSGQYDQNLPTIQKDKSRERLGDDLSTFVSRAYRMALNREPSNHELRMAMHFITTQQADYEQHLSATARATALADFVQAVFSLNEFVYVD
jgi:hypothetical protein